MSGYILCQVKRAKLPYYIENISTNIYSIEELCFYFYHNIYLLDSTILNEELCFWIRDQLGLKKLAENLYKHLDDDEMKVGDFILPVFKEISYLSLEEFRRLNQQIRQLANEPEVLRQKRKGDYLMEHGKYVNAIKVYQRALRREAEDDIEVTDIRKPEATEAAADHTVGVQETTENPAGAEAESPVAITIDMMEDPQGGVEEETDSTPENPETDAAETDSSSSREEKQEEVTPDQELPRQEILLGKQFIGEIYHNMGCAYARLFQMEEAIRCFEIAYGKLHTMGAVKSLLYAVYMEHGVDAFVEKAKQLEVDEERQEEIYVEVEEAVEDLYDTPEGQEYGYIFSDCRFISKDCPAGSVYLGRPWRDYAKTILISCELGAHIHPAGFHDWNRENTHDTVYYAEYASFPATSDYRPLSDRADFVQNLNEQQAGYFAK